MIPVTIKWPQDARELVLKASAYVGLTYSSFMRQAAVEKARALLGLEPRLPVYKQGSPTRMRHPKDDL
jgi:uncharacterized protein (DUF1778 family)